MGPLRPKHHLPCNNISLDFKCIMTMQIIFTGADTINECLANQKEMKQGRFLTSTPHSSNQEGEMQILEKELERRCV